MFCIFFVGGREYGWHFLTIGCHNISHMHCTTSYQFYYCFFANISARFHDVRHGRWFHVRWRRWVRFGLCLFYAISFLVYVFHVLVQYTQNCTKTKLSLLKMVFTHFNCKACTIEKCHVYKYWDETTFSSLMQATNVCNLLVLIVNIKCFVCRSTKRTAILNQM